MDRNRLSRELKNAQEGEARLARIAGYGELAIASLLFGGVLFLLLSVMGG
ncbi:MAG: hypothetical protein P8X75_00980 [Limibacillus sp.]|jgi:hypothetical protein